MAVDQKHFSNRMIFWLLWVMSISVLIRTAWLGDDSFITMRTVDNWINGYGLTWNVGERVQTYTHPMWMLMLSVVYFFVRDGYFTLLIFNITVSVFVFAIFFKYYSNDDFSLLFGFGILVLSKAFIDYSTSGLENALTHLLLLIFAIEFLKPVISNKSFHLFIISLVAGLAATNRMDSVLFFIPALIYAWAKDFRNARGTGLLLAGFSPFMLWEAFSLFYYGFLFPNTAYAKLNSGIPEQELLRQGILYFINSITWDPMTLMVISIALLVTVVSRGNAEKMLAAGIGLYLMYILYIGGDFMSGRFFSSVFILSAFMLTKYVKELDMRNRLIISGILLVAGILSPASTVTYFLKVPGSTSNLRDNIDAYSMIADERQSYYQSTSPLLLNRGMEMPQHPWVENGVQYKKNKSLVAVVEAAGFVGYFAGPDVHIIDIYALGDALLARLEVVDYKPWRIGHFQRDLPNGYIDTIKIGKNKIKNPDLAQFYDKLKIIISGNLYSIERIRTIFEMNTGKYDYLIERYGQLP